MLRRKIRYRRLALGLFAYLAAALPAHADQPVLHEYIPPDPLEDLRMQATTEDGAMPAAIKTPSGVLAAPGPSRPESDSEQVAYGGNATPDSIDSSYRIDRDTYRPDVVRYHDPFIPAVTPFKRLYAYDAPDEGLELVVHDRRLVEVEIGGEARAGDDQFYGDMLVDVAAGVPVRIPSVGPGARILVARVDPPMKFQIVRDGAENWFMLGNARKRARLVLELAIPRAAFGSEFADASWVELAPKLMPVPSAARVAAMDVLRGMGISQADRPRVAVAALVQYFRGFAPSDLGPRATSGVALYAELAQTKKGVCRHRAYAFVVTALALGLPARFVRNEAHAWVEVYDGSIWHRIDLGGAAGRIDYEDGSSEHLHRPPADPYRWPEGSEATATLADRAAAAFAAGPPGAPSPSGAGRASRGRVPAAPAADSSDAADTKSSPAEVSLSADPRELSRGARLHVWGKASADDEACAYSRVDLALRDGRGAEHWLGALATNPNGRYDGQLTIPFDLDVGEYSIVASSPKSARCSSSTR